MIFLILGKDFNRVEFRVLEIVIFSKVVVF